MSYKLKRLAVSEELILAHYRDRSIHAFKVISGLPAGTRITEINIDHFRIPSAVDLILENESWPDLKPGDPIPYVDPITCMSLPLDDKTLKELQSLEVIETEK